MNKRERAKLEKARAERNAEVLKNMPEFETIEEAEDWCQEYFEEEQYNQDFYCCFDDCDIRAINPTIRQLVVLSEEFPEIAAGLRFVESRDFGEDIVAAVNYDISGIGLSPRWYGNYERLKSRRGEAERFGECPEGCGLIEALITHEFAHEIHHYFLRKPVYVTLDGTTGPLYEVFSDWLEAFDLLGVETISGFSLTNHGEFFAEAFASYYHNPNPGWVEEEVYRVVSDLMRQAGETTPLSWEDIADLRQKDLEAYRSYGFQELLDYIRANSDIFTDRHISKFRDMLKVCAIPENVREPMIRLLNTVRLPMQLWMRENPCGGYMGCNRPSEVAGLVEVFEELLLMILSKESRKAA